MADFGPVTRSTNSQTDLCICLQDAPPVMTVLYQLTIHVPQPSEWEGQNGRGSICSDLLVVLS